MMKVAKRAQERLHIGPYRILAKIGEGGMGTVYLTKMDGPPGFHKLAVVKELRSDLTGSRRLVEMFLNEVRLAARLTHPNVVHTYGANEEDASLYLAMEYLDGQPWSRVRHALWHTGSLPFGLHIKVLAEVLAGLHYAHELRDYDGTALEVVHCDVSPQNVFVTYDGQIKVVDFGVACAVSGERRSGTKMLVGKLAYVAPEQARGEELDRRADIFSVGVMLWELMAGKRFAQRAAWRVLRERRATGAEPRIREVAPDAPAKLAEICDRAMAFDPNRRFATAGEFREALLNYLGGDMQDSDHVQLGELVREAFQNERARIHGLIERHLSSPDSLPGEIEDHVSGVRRPEPVEYTLKADLSELASVSRIDDEAALLTASSSASIRVTRRLPPLPFWIGAILVLLSMWLWTKPSDPEASDPSSRIVAKSLPPTAAGPAPAPIASSSAPAPLAVAPNALTAPTPLPGPRQMFELSLSASPPEASFLLDGVPLPGNPFSEQYAADNDLHLLRAVGPNLQSQERVITFDRDRSVTFTLSRLWGQRRHARARRAQAEPVERASVPALEQAPVMSVRPQPPEPTLYEAPPIHPKPGEPMTYDAPLSPRSGARAIYEEDPYP